jgi:transcriptional regulator with XRE-family HTH domain
MNTYTKEQLAAALLELGLTQTELAASLDISARTMRRYVAGDARIPRVVELAIELLLLKYRAR